ncbi:MAG: hypothetical protein LBT30_02795 [Clostridiales bacterium]|jgi:hypothetical protein|nr:hypothetical protein [Clostridiales bacterium]
MNYAEYFYMGVFAAAVVGGFLVGLTRGFKRSLYRTVLTVISILLTVGLLPKVLDALLSFDFTTLSGSFSNGLAIGDDVFKTPADILTTYMYQYAGSFLADFPSAEPLVLGLLKMLVSVLVFGVLFAIVNFFFTVVFWLTKGLVDNKNTQGKRFKNKKLLGGLSGAVNGLLVAFIALTPVLGATDLVKDYVKDETVRGYLPQEALQYIDQFTDYDGFVKTIFGAEGIDIKFFNKITEVTLDNEEKTKLSAKDFKEFSTIIGDALYFVNNVDKFKDYTSLSGDELREAIGHIKNIVDFLFDNGVTGVVLNDGLKYMKDHPLDQLFNVSDSQLTSVLGSVNEALFGADNTLSDVKAAVDSLFDFVSDIAEDAIYLVAHSGEFGEIMSGAGDAQLFDSVKNILHAALSDTGIIGKVLDDYLVSGNVQSLFDSITGDATTTKLVALAKEIIFGAPSDNKSLAAVKNDLGEIIDFAVDLVASPLFNDLKGGISDASGLTQLFQNEDLIALLETHLPKATVLKTFNGLISFVIADALPAAELPLVDFFTYLSGHPASIGAELTAISDLLSADEIGGLISGGAIDEDALTELGNLKDLFTDANYDITIGGRVVIAVLSNVINEYIHNGDSSYVPVYNGILKTPAGDDWTTIGWNNEADSIFGLLDVVADLLGNATLDMETIKDSGLGVALDEFKNSKNFESIYNDFIGFLLDKTGQKDEIDKLVGEDYKSVSWADTFVLLSVVSDLSGQITDLIDVIDDYYTSHSGDMSAFDFNTLLSNPNLDLDDIKDALQSVSGTLNEYKDKISNIVGTLLDDASTTLIDNDTIVEWVGNLLDFLSA